MIRIALCFPGQGSQSAGMAAGLLDLPLSKRLLGAADECGVDLAAALGGDGDSLRPTEVAQPGLYFVEVVLSSLLPRGVEVLGVAGHSIGEYAALVAAGVLDPVLGMALVIQRGLAMAAMDSGTMAAVLGLETGVVEEICRGVATTAEPVVVANINAPGQVVISGSVAAVAAASAECSAQGARRVLPLNVSGAFHSPLMTAAADAFAIEIDRVHLSDTKIPVVSNVDGQASTRAEEIRQRLRRQIASPVRWTDCVARLAGLGADVLVEVGPGSVLTGLAKRIAPGVGALSVGDAAAVAGLLDTVGARSR